MLTRRRAGGSLVLSGAGVVAALACAAACSRPAAAPASAAPSPSPKGAAASAADLSRPLPSPVPEIVARVNGEPIRLARVLPLARAELDRLRPAAGQPRLAEAVRLALGRCVERELLLQEALARGVTADDRQVAWAFDQLRREYSDEAKWEAYLAGEGYDARSFRAELREQQTIGALVEREARERGLGPDEARAALVDRLRARSRVELLL